jgi:CheY-like chemotaxis protein
VRRILVVDDRAIVREFMEEVLGGAGHEVSSAEGGERALEMLQESTFGVMFLDLGLPGMNGLELCRRIRRDHPAAFLHAVAAYPSAYDFADCRAAGFDDYFIKPVLADEILKAAEDAFEKIDRWDRECDPG